MMIREKLEIQIRVLQDEILSLGSMVEAALLASVDSLRKRDPLAARKVYDQDQIINEKRYAIENALVILMATQQPIARDLRLMVSMLEVIVELERMGDYAKGIAKVTWQLEGIEAEIPMQEFSQMVEKDVNMLHRSLTSFINEDAELAARIAAEDDIVDALYNRAYQCLVQLMIHRPEVIDHSNALLWVAHNLERAADRVVNICERVVFIATGDILEFDTPDDDRPE
jgi:phosphate transport system protein